MPSKIEVISAETIQRSGFTSLPDLLKNYSSVDVIQYPGFNATVGIRGFKPGKAYTTVLINGIPRRRRTSPPSPSRISHR